MFSSSLLKLFFFTAAAAAVSASEEAPANEVYLKGSVVEEEAPRDLGGREPMLTISQAQYRPGPIARGRGQNIYVGRLLWGGVMEVNVITGAQRMVAPDTDLFAVRASIGLTYYKEHLIMTATGPIGNPFSPLAEIYVYDINARSLDEAEVLKCSPPSTREYRFLNSQVRKGNKIYMTDAEIPWIVVFDLKEALKGNCVVDEFELQPAAGSGLPGNEFLGIGGGGETRATGIEPFGNGFLISNQKGAIYWYSNAAEGYYKVSDSGNLFHMVLHNGNRLYASQLLGFSIQAFEITAGGDGDDDDTIPVVTQIDDLAPFAFFPNKSAIWEDILYVGMIDLAEPLFSESEQNPDTWDYEFFVQGFPLPSS